MKAVAAVALALLGCANAKLRGTAAVQRDLTETAPAMKDIDIPVLQFALNLEVRSVASPVVPACSERVLILARFD